MQYYPQLIIDALKQVRYPGNGKNLVENEMVEDDIRIDGKLIGTLKSNGKIVLGQNGNIEGDIYCKHADLSGRVTGKIFVDELTSLKSTSRVEGELSTKQLYIEIGAIFTGKCEMGKIDSTKVENKK